MEVLMNGRREYRIEVSANRPSEPEVLDCLRKFGRLGPAHDFMSQAKQRCLTAYVLDYHSNQTVALSTGSGEFGFFTRYSKRRISTKVLASKLKVLLHIFLYDIDLGQDSTSNCLLR